MDNSVNENKETLGPDAEYPPEHAYTISIGPIEPDRGSTKLPVTVPLIIMLDGKRYVAGHITFGADGQIADTGLIRPLSQESLRHIRRHVGSGFAIGDVSINSGLYTEEPPYSRIRGSRLRTPVQEYKGSFEPPEEDYRKIPYALRAGFARKEDIPEITLVDPAMNPYEHDSVNWLRSTVGMAPVTDEQIVAVMKTFASFDAWNAMISDLLIAQPPVIVSAMNRMFPPEPE